VSEADVEVMRRAFEALAEDGVEALLPYIDEDFLMTTPSHLAAEPDTYRGHDGVRRWFDSFYEAMDRVRIEPEALEDVGDKVAMRYRIVARGRTTGLEMVQEAVLLATVSEGKATRIEFFSTMDEARAAGGG
jgi:ketosteroid isomerase-like protein